MSKIAVSCVVDKSPNFVMQCWNWLLSLRALGTQDRADIFVHHTSGVAKSHLETFSRLGARLVEIDAFGEGDLAYCNKIQQLQSGQLSGYDYVVLSDADIFFLSCPTRLATGAAIKAKLVDQPNPPVAIWRQLLLEAGLTGSIKEVPIELAPTHYTFSTCFNGGLYVIPGALLADLSRLWPKWAHFCLNNRKLLDRWRLHSDQLGFGMAILEQSLAYEHLQIGENFPTHFAVTTYAGLKPQQIHAIHYHSQLNEHGHLQRTGVSWIDKQIDAANQVIVEGRRDDFDNSSFWDFRYHSAPELGSGLGSRGAVLKFKESLLRPYMKAISNDNVIDVGCGDIEIMRTMPLRNYLGIDVSGESIKLASHKRSDWSFKVANISEFESGSYDYAICLDVLIHQSAAEQFDDLLKHLIRVCRKGVFVSGYSCENPNSGIVFTHRSLSDALRKNPDINEVIEIGSYRDVNLYLALKQGGMPKTDADASIADIAFGCNETAEWPLLLDLVRLSREELGFFPKTIIRTVEYPWFARRMISDRDRRVLDIGAGVCALPLWLSREGCSVVTIDFSPNVRELESKQRWNEWGYLDYGQIDPRISSHQINALNFEPDKPFDTIYSVSVIEHMPAEIRRGILAKLPNWLAPGGRVLFSIDLVPGTDDLWPLSEGKTVDPPGKHGTFPALIAEIENSGLRIIETAIRRGIVSSRTDLAFVEAVLPLAQALV